MEETIEKRFSESHEWISIKEGIGTVGVTHHAQKQLGNIGHDAHFGGAIGGYVITLILAPWLFTEHILMVILLAIPIVLLYVMRKTGKI